MSEPFVRPLAEALDAEIVAPLDVEYADQLESVFEQISQRWGRLDFVLHAVAYAPAADLHGGLLDSSADGFARAMDVSCHSLIRMARLAEPLMSHGGTLIRMSDHGAQKIISHYGLMGPVKAALEAAVRCLAAQLGPAGMRVHAVSPGPMRTRAHPSTSR